MTAFMIESVCRRRISAGGRLCGRLSRRARAGGSCCVGRLDCRVHDTVPSQDWLGY